jgi:membrane peptidoglycan carboxypeptidase
VTRTSDRGNDDRPTTAGWIALILFVFLAGVGVVAALAVIGVYSSLSSGLKDVAEMQKYQLPEETIVLDREGAELARFGDFKRELVEYEDIAPILLDATTAIEDKTFWENAGFDPVAIVAAGLDSLRGSGRGASTVTQQLTRMRLLEDDLLQDPDRLAERKLKEIIQSVRLTQAYPGEPGKRKIITAYLNQIYYGNQSYGVKAAAKSYFGVDDLNDLTVAQAAILAALPKSPSNYDLVRNAVEECQEAVDAEGNCPSRPLLVVPPDSTVVERRNQILRLMAEGDRTPISGDQYSQQDFLDAIDEPVVLVPQTETRWKAPHFVWAVRDELATKLCGGDETCPELNQGGLRVTTTIDSRLQDIAEKWVRAATWIPFRSDPQAAAEREGLEYEPWMANLRDKRLRNGALVAIDYQTGELVAYVGSAGYYGNSSARLQRQYDVVGRGYRQPGSAFKPFNYAIGIESKALTAATVFMDAGTDFGNGFAPNNADRLERGPVRLRSALQFSLNIPSVKAVAVNDPANVFARAQDFGMRFRGDASQAGLSLALGTQETPPVDLVTAYATLANRGSYLGHTTILRVQNRAGDDVIDPYMPPEATQVVSPQTAHIVTDILAGNTNTAVNPYWGEFQILGPEGRRRPATLKTGTNNDAKDLNAYGYIAAPTPGQRQDGAYALAVGAWNGNSDNTEVSTPENPLFSIDVSTYVWQGFLQEAAADWPIRNFAPPEEGLTQAVIDPFTGFLARPGQEGVEEWFLSGTEPTARFPNDVCGPDALSEIGYEDRFETWLEADRDWLARARRGPGTVGGPRDTRVSYFYNNGFNPFGRTWGPLLGRDCASPPVATCFPLPSPDASGAIPSFTLPSADPSGQAVVPCSPPPATASPSVPPSEPPSEPPVTAPPVTPPPVTPPPVTPPPVTPPPVTPPPVTPAPSAAPLASPAT